MRFNNVGWMLEKGLGISLSPFFVGMMSFEPAQPNF